MSKRIIDLRSPEGNSFSLLAAARVYARSMDREWPPLLERLTSGDYENLVRVMIEEFGDVIEFVNLPWDN